MMTTNSVGAMLARFAIEGAKKGATTNGQRMCEGCAFKSGTPANGEAEAAGRALEALISDHHVFNCHIHRDQRCAGYLLALAAED